MSSPGIITYPLGGITYDAEDAAAYFAGRTSGVYSTDIDFAVAAAADGSTDLTVSAGQAWMHVSRWVGLSITMREAQTLTLPLADSALPRIDRVVLRYDATSRSTSLQVLQGAPSSEPAGPDLSRTEMVYDLCLAEVSRPAGQTSVSTADLTDTRTDEALCGLMRDGVTGIPTAQLQAQALAMMTQLSTELHTKLDALDAAIAAVESGSFYTKAEADAKFGTPYTLPAATAAQLGGVKVGEALDIAADGTLSAKTLNDKIAAAVAVKSEPRLVWNHYEETGKRWKTYDIKMPDGLDYVHVKTKYNSSTGGYGEEVDIAKGGTANHSYGNGTGIFASNTTFQTNGTLHFATETSTGGYTVEIWLTGYHYPTLADLLTQVTAVESSVTDLQVALCELYEEKEEN